MQLEALAVFDIIYFHLSRSLMIKYFSPRFPRDISLLTLSHLSTYLLLLSLMLVVLVVFIEYFSYVVHEVFTHNTVYPPYKNNIKERY